MTLPLPLLPLGSSCFVAKSVVVRGGACLLRRGGGGTGTAAAAAAATASFAATYCSNYSRRRRHRSHPRCQPPPPIEIGPVDPRPRSDPTYIYSQNGGGNNNFSNRSSTQHRSYSSGSGSKNNNTTNNFRILGLPSNASFKEVQQAFLTLALQYHPDTTTTTTTSGGSEEGTDANGDANTQMKLKGKTREENEHHFIRIRQAYEQLRLDHKIHEKIYGKQYDNNNDETREKDTDRAAGDEDLISSYSETQFLHWFYEQTGLLFTSEQRREMITLYRNRVGNYDGPAWDITRRLVEYQEMYLTRMYQQQQQQQQGNTRNSDRDDEHAKKTYTTKRSATKNTTTNSTPIRRRRQR